MNVYILILSFKGDILVNMDEISKFYYLNNNWFIVFFDEPFGIFKISEYLYRKKLHKKKKLVQDRLIKIEIIIL